MPRLSKIGAAALAAFGFSSGGATAVTASYLVVAGGGSGGGASQNISGTSAGGGAGGYQTGTTSLALANSYTVTVGAGGAAVSSSTATGNSGSNSSFGTLTASVGGGFGQSGNASSAGAGGSGGGAANSNLTGGAPTSGQGNAGGAPTVSFVYAGGGGGAGAAGSNGNVSNSGAGGAGTASSITGSSVTYAGGGGGGGSSIAGAGAGGSGGGGAGGANLTTGTSGTANLGGGGGAGGAGNNGTVFSGSGGSGIVIISYTGAQQFGGGVITTSGGSTIHTFTTSGVLSPISSLSASYLIVAGGGAGGGYRGGGGGSGGLLSGSALTIDTASTYLVTVGAGGTQNTTTTGGNGTNSAFGLVSTASVGGGGGGSNYGGSGLGANGGSGGGATGNGALLSGGTGTASQGNNGGSGAGASFYGGGGGGGAGAVGVNGTGAGGGNGGTGTTSSISGASTYYAGGGGGGCFDAGGVAGNGGNGGGGAGTAGNTTGNNGTANLGGGGGGAGQTGATFNTAGGNGGSGVVIISYAGATQQMAGGSVTITGGNVIHTFTSSGYLTPLVYVGNSLRFRSSASAYLGRTPSVASNRKTWTWSGWVKRGALGATGGIFDASNTGSQLTTSLKFDSADTISFQLYIGPTTYNSVWTTSAVYRDPAAWYHIVFSLDTTQASQSNMAKLYVNGVLQALTIVNYYSAIPQNSDWYINSTNAHRIASYYGGTYLDGYMANIQFIDGQALTPNSFGTFNSYGVWQPINYGGSYGTNGFYLPFTPSSSGYAAYFGNSGSSGNAVTVPLGSAGVFGTGNFTIESWVFLGVDLGSGANPYLIDTRNSAQWAFSWNWNGTSNAKQLAWTNASGTVNQASVDTPIGQWCHCAYVRNSGVGTIYLNGVAISTFTDTSNYSTSVSTAYLGKRFSSVSTVPGSLSNFRIVIGTAVYTSNFTPPTTSLTAISGTSLLTFQNATIVDNSTNALTLTVVGTVTTGITYPFSYAIANDNSPQGNNWTQNNISGQAGSTLDYMTDVPTLTSATAANYAVLNPLDSGASAITTTNANLSCYRTGNTTSWAGIRGSMGFTTGKYYFETQSSVSAGFYQLGVANASLDLTTDPKVSANAWVLYTSNGNAYNGSSNTYGSATTSNNDIVMCAFDMTAGKIWWGLNGTWFASGVPSSGTNPAFTNLTGTLFPLVGVYGNSSGNPFAINFGQQPFVYTPPSGYVALNTYNL